MWQLPCHSQRALPPHPPWVAWLSHPSPGTTPESHWLQGTGHPHCTHHSPLQSREERGFETVVRPKDHETRCSKTADRSMGATAATPKFECVPAAHCPFEIQRWSDLNVERGTWHLRHGGSHMWLPMQNLQVSATRRLLPWYQCPPVSLRAHQAGLQTAAAGRSPDSTQKPSLPAGEPAHWLCALSQP